MRLPSINGLRAISIIIVIVHHLSLQNHIFECLENIQLLAPFIDFMQDGYLGVNIFFVISGFLITFLLLTEEKNTKRVSLKNFYIRRTLRIFPAYYFLLLVYFILQLAGFIQISNSSWMSAITYTKYFNLGLDWYTSHAWSLSVEEHFYLFWPFIFNLGDKLRKQVSLLLVLLVPVLKMYLFYHPVAWMNDFTIFTRIDAIAIGCGFALFKDEILSVLSKCWKPVFYFSLLSLFFLRYLSVLTNKVHLNFILIPLGSTHGTIANILIAILLMYAVFGPKGLWFRFLNNKVVNYIGMLSYSLYLWQQVFITNSGSWFNKAPLNIVFIFIAALVSYYLVEKPFLKLKSKFEKPRNKAEKLPQETPGYEDFVKARLVQL